MAKCGTPCTWHILRINTNHITKYIFFNVPIHNGQISRQEKNNALKQQDISALMHKCFHILKMYALGSLILNQDRNISIFMEIQRMFGKI